MPCRPLTAEHDAAASSARLYGTLCAATSFGAGVAGIVLHRHFSNPSYQPARHMLTFLPGDPAVWWSALLMVAAAAALYGIIQHHGWVTRTAFAVLFGFWLFWVLLYTVSLASEPSAGPWGPFLAFIAAVGHSRPVLSRTLTSI